MQYKESHNFNITSRANTFINNEIFFSMPADEKMFLVKMSAFESFTLAQQLHGMICQWNLRRVILRIISL